MDRTVLTTVRPAKREDWLKPSSLSNVLVVSAAATATAAWLILVVAGGWDYYATPLRVRAYAPAHPALRPSGWLGHSLGMAGLLMMTVPVIYSVRKKWKRLARLGQMRHWLDVHIFCGIFGPVLVTFHAALKFNGLIAVAFWSMVLVVASGFAGRYLYVRIPRTIRGVEMGYDCHTNGTFIHTRIDCFGCHEEDYREARNPNHVEAGFPTDCEACHRQTASTWGGGAFNHQSIFALVGVHATQPCAACHVNGVDRGTPRECVGCHGDDYQRTRDPNHAAAGFPTACQSCHPASASSWDASFNHNQVFALVGRHAQAACSACHQNGRYAGTPRDCVGCHRSDYDQTRDPDHRAAGFPTACETGHRASDGSWDDGRFDHVWFPITSGPHAGRPCSACHTVAGNFTSFSCTTCHSRGDTNPGHSVILARGIRVYGGYGRDRNNRQDESTDRFTYGFLLADLAHTGLDLSASDSRMEGGDGRSFNSWYVSVGRSIGSGVYLTGDYGSSLSVLRFVSVDGFTIETRPRTRRASISSTIRLPRRMSLLATLERVLDDDATQARL